MSHNRLIRTLLASLTLCVGLVGMFGGLMFVALAGLSAHTERDEIPGMTLLVASGMLALSGLLWLMAWSFPKAFGLWAAAALSHIVAVVAGIAYVLVMYGYMEADIFHKEQESWLFTILPIAVFLISAVELPFFLLTGKRSAGRRSGRTECNEECGKEEW